MTPRWTRWNERDADAPPRTPSLRQIHETECGAIALGIVLAHYGAWVPLPELRSRCDVTEQGVTALSLVQAARQYGLAIRAMRLPADNLRHIQAPVILFWENWHFVVLEGIRDDTAWVNDPARGHRRLSLPALDKSYSGIALVAQPGPEFRPMGSPRKPFRTAADMLRPGRWRLTLMGAAVLAESILLPLVVQRAGDAIDDAWKGRAADWRPGAFALAGLLAASAARHRLTDAALDAIAEPTRQQLAHALEDTSPHDGIWQSATGVSRHELADYPATTAVRTVTAGIRMTVGVPLLVLVHGRYHPAAALVAMAALATPALMQQFTARADAGAQVPGVGAHGAWEGRLGAWWPALRPFVQVSPVIVVGVLTPTDTLPAVIVALAASGFAFRLVDSSVQAFGMLYLLPESIVQLSDIDRQRGAAEHTP